jgi:Rod binding domain-containing protein
VSIAPSTDIVLEVSRAADPSRASAVAQKLEALSAQGGGSPQDFAAALDAASAAPAADARARVAGAALVRNNRAEQAPQKLEALVLTQFINEMLPKDTPNAYGQGFAGDMWRSMLAEKVADQIARSGRLGIASHLFAGRSTGAGAQLLAPAKSQAPGAQTTSQTSANPLSAPSGADIENGAELFARRAEL